MKISPFKRFSFLSLLVIALFLFSATAVLSGCGGGGGSSSSGSGGGAGSSVSGSVNGVPTPLAGTTTVSLYEVGNAVALASVTTTNGSFSLSYTNPGGNALLYIVATNGTTVLVDILGDASGALLVSPIVVDEATTAAAAIIASDYGFTLAANGLLAPPSPAPDYANVAKTYNGIVNGSTGMVGSTYNDANNLDIMSDALAECVNAPTNSACTNIDGAVLSNTNTTISVIEYIMSHLSSSALQTNVNAAETAGINPNPYSANPQTLTIPSGNSFTFDAASESPAGGSTGVSAGTAVSIAFSNPVDFSTVNTADFSLKPNGGSQVAGTFSPGSSDNIITFTPSSSLSTGTTYTAAVTTGIKDIYGNSLSAGTSWSFTTGTTLPAPTVTSISPLSSATGVSLSPIITVTFSEAMNINSFNATDTTVTSSGGTPVNIVNPVWNGTDTEVSVTPASPLTANTTYTITFTSGGIKAQNGTAIASAYTSSFTTASNAGTLVDMTPSGIAAANQLALVEMDKSGNIIFGEAINPTSSSFPVNLVQLSGTSSTIKNTYTVGANVSPTINNIVIDPTGNLWAPMTDAANGTAYLDELPAGSANNASFTQNTIPSSDSYYHSGLQGQQGFTAGFGMDSKGNIWLPVYNSVVGSGQLLEITGASGGAATVANTYSLPSTIVSVNGLAIDSSNNVWMTSSPSSCGGVNPDALLEFPSGGSSVSTAASLPVGACTQGANSIAIDPSGNIWILARSGGNDVLYYYPSGGPLSAAITLASAANYPDSMSVASDAAGNIWVALKNNSSGTGELIEVNNFGGSGFAVVGTPLSLSFAPDTTMFIDQNGNIWMTTNNNTTAANKLEEIPAIAAAGYFAVSGPVNPY